MSLKKIEQIKEGKWFRIWDLIAFGVILITAVALILAFTLGGDKSALSGFEINYRGETVFTYEFGGDMRILDNERVKVEDGDGGFTVYFTTDDGKGYNTIWVNTKNKTVDVTDSNCSMRKDCVYTAKMTNNSSQIYCLPHDLTILPLKIVDDGNIII